MELTKPARAKKKRTVLVNIMGEIGLVNVKMAGREKAPGLRAKDW